MSKHLATVEEKMDSVRQQAAESLESAADTVRDAGNQGATVISNLAKGAGKKLDSTADTVRDVGAQGVDAINQVAKGAKKHLDSTAAYVRSLEGEDLIADLRRAVQRHPVRTLALAATVGLIAGLTCRRGGSRS
jgi:ElaB/YqjD/DUF883 family membrane-anchored ribosome-binding protein